MTPTDPLIGRLVRIVDEKHPHYPEHGRLTGKLISVLGKPMTEVTLHGCVHGTDGCFVSAGQIELVRGDQRP
mgnify:CR=1 FL=1